MIAVLPRLRSKICLAGSHIRRHATQRRAGGYIPPSWAHAPVRRASEFSECPCVSGAALPSHRFACKPRFFSLPTRRTSDNVIKKITFVGCSVLPLLLVSVPLSLPLSLVSVPLSFSLSLWVLACLDAEPRLQSPCKRDRSALIPEKGCPKDAKKKPLNFERPFFL